MSKEKNEFDSIFESPNAAVAPSNIAPVSNTIAPVSDTAEAPANDFEDLFTGDGNQHVAAKKTWTPEDLAILLGGASGAALGSPAQIRGDTVTARLAESLYGAPAGSLSTAQGLANPLAPEALARAAAEKHVPAIPEIGASPLEAAPELTPGGKWGAKTGYGAGEGTVQEASSRYQRSLGKGKITAPMDKLFGPALPGESPQLSQRLIDRANAAENARLLQQQTAAEQAASQAEQARALEAATAEREGLVGKVGKNIERAGGLSNILQRGARMGLNMGVGALGGLQGYRAYTDMQTQGVTPTNALQATEGAGGLLATRYPQLGLPVAGIAAMGQAGQSIGEQGLTPGNASQMLSGAGLAVMPRAPIAGAAMQTPALALSIREWAKNHPDWWNKIPASGFAP
jgi:hypothetical protein